MQWFRNIVKIVLPVSLTDIVFHSDRKKLFVMMQSSHEAESCYSKQNPRIKMELLTFYRYVNIVTKENFNVFIDWFIL
jgi:hypothetical protein